LTLRLVRLNGSIGKIIGRGGRGGGGGSVNRSLLSGKRLSEKTASDGKKLERGRHVGDNKKNTSALGKIKF